MNIRKNDFKTDSNKTLFSMKYPKNTLNTAAKTCKIKSENQVKAKVKATTTTTVQFY
jgi:hypothetical protein